MPASSRPGSATVPVPVLVGTGRGVAGGDGSLRADSQRRPSAFADDSDYEDSAWEEDLAGPVGQMADKVGPTMGLGGGEERAG